MRLSLPASLTGVVLSALLLGCSAVDVTSGNTDAAPPPPAPSQVGGTLTFVRGWGATEFPRPDTSYFDPTPLSMVEMDLMVFIGDREPPGRIMASTQSDGEGRYVLFAPPGTYYLVVRAGEHTGVFTGMPWFTQEDKVSHLEVVELRDGLVLIRDFEIHEMVPQ